MCVKLLNVIRASACADLYADVNTSTTGSARLPRLLIVLPALVHLSCVLSVLMLHVFVFLIIAIIITVRKDMILIF